jgi:hypothetical protein
MTPQRVFGLRRWPAIVLVLVLLAIGGLGLASLRFQAVSRELSLGAAVCGCVFGVAFLSTAVRASRIEIGSAGITVVVAGRRARLWWPEIAAIGPVTRRGRVLVAVPADGVGTRRGPVHYDERCGGWVLARAGRVKAGLPAVAEAVERYAPGIWRET